MEALSSAPALSDDFLSWWFAPWDYLAPASPAAPRHCDDLLGARDAYQAWCARAGVMRALPVEADLRWQPVALRETDVLLRAAELFGGLFAARERRHAALAELAPTQRRWCLGVASTQPLQRWKRSEAAVAGPPLSLRHDGLAELALRLESAFPGMWSRLRLLLPDDERDALTQAMPSGHIAAGTASRALPRERERQCWLLCQNRARAA